MTAVERATTLFSVLADPTPTRILLALSLVERLCVCEVAASPGLRSRRQAISCGGSTAWCGRAPDGRIAYYSLADGHVRHVLGDALRHVAENVPAATAVAA